MTNSQRFGGGLLHFWLLSTVYWPEACTSRTQAQGKCMCMETGIYIHTKRAHTHTHTHKHACAHTHRTNNKKQAIRHCGRNIKSWKAGRGFSLFWWLRHATTALTLTERKCEGVFSTIWPPTVGKKHNQRLTRETETFLSFYCKMNFHLECLLKQSTLSRWGEEIPVFTEVVSLLPSWKEMVGTLISVWNDCRHDNKSSLPERHLTHPFLGCTAYGPCSPVNPWAADALSSERCGQECWQHLSAAGTVGTTCQNLWKISGKLYPLSSNECTTNHGER